MDSSYLFVYGTLLQDFNNAISRFLTEQATFVAKGYFNGKLFEVDNFPGAILTNVESEKVFGSLYKISDSHKTFEVLDAYEGVADGLYKRLLVEAYLDSGNSVKTWAYIFNHSTKHLKQISSGDYLKHSN